MRKKQLSRTRLNSITITTLLLVSTLFSLFSTTADPSLDGFTLKWSCSPGLLVYCTPVSIDINGDGVHELFMAGTKDDTYRTGRIVCIDGLTGELNWEQEWSSNYVDPMCPCVIADLDNDGTYEIVHVADDKTTARNCEDGSIFWDVDVPSGWHQFVIVDTDGNGYPYVYVTDHGSSGGNQKVSKLRGTNGEIVAQHPIFYSCYGGVSAADLEGDGEIEIIVSDTSSGNGLQCFDEDLNLIWYQGGVNCGSHCGAIADVDGDGVLDVIALRQGSNGGICVVDGSTGTPFPGKNQGGLGLGCHVQPSVYDIDKDGHLELVTAYGSTCKVWDLVDWSLDFEAPSTHKCSEPPDFANVVGDEDLELIIPSGWAGQTLVYDSSYQLVYQFNEYGICTMTQDVDNDGLNEILYLRNDILICYDTAANAPTPSVRTDTLFYSERRTAAGEYIPHIGGSVEENHAPIFSAVTPSNGVTSIPIGISSLSVTIEDPDGDLFDWTIETSPDIGSSQANGAGNGLKSFSISGLSYSTTYRWFVNATDGEDWTRRLYSFTTESELSDWYPGWLYRKEITIDHSQVAEDLSNFPVLIHRDSDSDLVSHAQSSGNDIMFTDLSGAKLSHEIELYDGATGELDAWVNVPSLSGTVDTVLYMYYGNVNCGSQENKIETWDGNFKNVCHLNNDCDDSTDNGYVGVDHGSTRTSGIIASGRSFDGIDDYISYGQFLKYASFTLECWVNFGSYTQNDFAGMIWLGNGDTAWGLYANCNNADIIGGRVTDGTSRQNWNIETLNNVDYPSGWHYLVFKSDSSVLSYLKNGNVIDSIVQTVSNTGSSDLSFGRWSIFENTNFNGIMDEVRISNSDRSDGWIKTSYNTIANPDVFLSISTESEHSSWYPGWLYRKEITIDHSLVAADLSNFPVFIHRDSDSDLVSHAQSSGNDILFTGQSGAKLSHEIESYDGSTGKLDAWVNVPSLSGTVDTVLYMYYGNANCGSQEDAEKVWDDDYAMVHHLDETSGTHYDSTYNDNDGSPVNNVDQSASGKIDGADGFYGIDSYVRASDANSLDLTAEGTLEAWIKMDSVKTYGGIIHKGDQANWNDEAYSLQFWTSGKACLFLMGSGSYRLDTVEILSTDVWYHVVGMWNANGMYIYVNGAMDNSKEGTYLVRSTSGGVNIGAQLMEYYSSSWKNFPFDGVIDEIRISSSDRSDGWIETSYNTVANPDTFLSVGSEQT